MRTTTRALFTAIFGFAAAGCNLVADLGDEPILVPAPAGAAGAGTGGTGGGGTAGTSGNGGASGAQAGGAAGATAGSAGTTAGSAGSAGAMAGSAGSAGATAGSAGSAGSAGAAGMSGSAGKGGGGAAGSGGAAGTTAGNAGTAGSSGVSGAAGQGGEAGSGGGGSAGAGGESGAAGGGGAAGGPPAPTCEDLERNGGEADTDCGGPCTKKCADTLLCNGGDDCQSGACFNGKCRAPKCDDELTNGTETDLDCGGDCTKKCPVLSDCLVDTDCESGACVQGPNSKLCLQPTCEDTRKNGAETDTDCGGSCNQRCEDDQGCKVGGDCKSGVCDGTKCVGPSCGDSVQNGAESDRDCGGGVCGKCDVGRDCLVATDCTSGVCANHTCAAASCTDNVKNVTETDVDCGGPSCGRCDLGKACSVANDCVTLNCAGNTCAPPTCTDLAKNQTETDVDCGGGCNPCVAGKGCALNADCDSGVCINDLCAAPTCNDTTRNGTEADVDCGAVCGSTKLCVAGQKCGVAGDCASGSCMNGICQKGCSDISCSSDATCSVVAGTATCLCRTSFVGDGTTCQAIFATESPVASVDGSVGTSTTVTGDKLQVDIASTPTQTFFTLPIAAIPYGAVITEASFRVTSVGAVSGTKVAATHFRDGYGVAIVNLTPANRPPIPPVAPNSALPGLTLSPLANTTYTIPIPIALMQERVNAGAGAAFYIRLHATAGAGTFASSEHSNVNFRPTLIVKYRRVIGSYPAPIVADTWADSKNANVVQPAGDLKIGPLTTGGTGTAYLRFDVEAARAAIPSYATISGATFSIVGKGGYAYGGNGYSYLSELPTDTWQEATLNWTNRPTGAAPSSLDWFLFWDNPNSDIDKPDQPVFRFSADLGARAAVAGKKHLSLELACTGYRHKYWSRDAGTRAPALMLTTVAK